MHVPSWGKIMSSTKKLWVAVLYSAFLAIALLQAHDAWVWAKTPWMGFTVLDSGRLMYRRPADLPPALKSLDPEGSRFLIAVRVGERWIPITDDHDQRLGKSQSAPRASWSGGEPFRTNYSQGIRLALSAAGDRIAIGDWRYGYSNFESHGRVSAYQLDRGRWVQLGESFVGDYDSAFRVALSGNGKRLAIGNDYSIRVYGEVE